MFNCQKCGIETRRWKRCDDHYQCDDCGEKENGLCTYTYGVLCDPCHKSRVQKAIERFSADTDYTSVVICPWCGYQFSDSWELSDGEHECYECNNKFELSRTVEVSYSTERAK